MSRSPEEQKERACARSRAWYAAHKDKAKERGKKYVAGHLAEYRAYKKAWAEANPDKHRRAKLKNHLRRNFNMSIEKYDEMLAQQDGKCAICKEPPKYNRLAVDHCHLTGRVRGLLCVRCNSIAGATGDRVELLRAIADYLEED